MNKDYLKTQEIESTREIWTVKLNFLGNEIKENIIDAIGIAWLFENAGEKVWDTGCALLILYIRWSVKLILFILIVKAIMWSWGHI